MLIIPDVHGRDFWKEAVNLREPGEEIIFLGDYVDPYTQEGIKLETVPETLEEIIKLAREEEGITLLLGNHDLMYMDYDHMKDSCRHDYSREPKITNILCGAKDIFKVAYKSGKYVFSHAGIKKTWVKNHPEIFGENPKNMSEVVEICNSSVKSWDPRFILALLDKSWWRGGDMDTNVGSMIWSDIREGDETWEGEDIFQVFGHTQLIKEEPVVKDNYALVDCRRIIRLKDDKFTIL